LKKPFWFQVKTLFSTLWNPLNRRVLPGTKKRFYLEPKTVDLWGQPKNTFGTVFIKDCRSHGGRGVVPRGVALFFKCVIIFVFIF
jgi:hypothetical protein